MLYLQASLVHKLFLLHTQKSYGGDTMSQQQQGTYRLIRKDRITGARFPVKEDLTLADAIERARRENAGSDPNRDLHCVANEAGDIVYEGEDLMAA
jgi:hypothetical protein